MRKLLLLIFSLIPSLVWSETYHFLRIDNTQGLSNNQVDCIFRDSRGFMWFGTNYGLNRYDGNSFKVYKSVRHDTASLVYNSISEIQEDVNGNLWLRGAGYQVYDIRTEKFLRNISPLLIPLGIRFTPDLIEIDQQKNFYFYQSDTGIYKYNVHSRKLVQFLQGEGVNGLSAGTVINIKPAGDAFWVLYQSGLVERFNERTNSVDFRSSFVQEHSLESSIAKRLFVDTDGNPWVFPGKGDKGVVCYEMKRGGWVYFGNDRRDFRSPADKLISSDLVRAIAQDQQGQIWIATDHGGVNIYNRNAGTFTVLRNNPMNPNSLGQNSTISLFSDPTGIMWVGTYKNGISYYHPDMFKFEKSPLFFYQNPGLEKDCNSLYEDSRGNLWIGTNGSGLLKYDPRSGTFRHYRNGKNDPGSISSDIITASIEDKSGTMWFGTFMGGLNQMKGERFVRYLPQVGNPNSLSNKSIYGLIEDENQNLWIATLGSGVDRLDAARRNFYHHNTANNSGMSSNYILSMYSKFPGTIYVCTSRGVDILNTTTGQINAMFGDPAMSDQLSELIIYNTLSDQRNLLWIATDNGLNVYDPERRSISYLNTSNGLPSEQVVSLAEDSRGNIWAGTRNGLAWIRCVRNDNTRDYSFEVVAFDENDGLVSNIFNQNAVFRNREGKIYFGTTKGYVEIDQKKIRFNKTVPVPHFSALYVGNEEILPGKKFHGKVLLDESITHTGKIVLSYRENNFALKFSALSYIHPQKNKYRYMLKGFDSDWKEDGGGNVSYSNLNQGNYELLIYAGNNDNEWSREPLVLKITVKPPFWFSWWAIVLYVLLVLGVVWIIVHYNLRKQKREFENEQRIREAKQLHEIDEMKFRFFTNISHEFRTPLTLILSPLEKLLRTPRDEEERNLLDIIRRNANGLLDLVNQLLDFRKLDDDKDKLHLSVGDVVAFIRDICYSFTEMANRKSVVFSFSTSVSELRMEFDPGKLRKIINNLLSNAFKFTGPDGKIELVISLMQQMNDSREFLKVVVSDTGCGIPEKDLGRIFERFYRVEHPDHSHQTGTGVGLHIVSEYIRMHHGHIQVESQVGKGTVFTFSIPAVQHFQEEIISQAEKPVAETEVPEAEPAAEEVKSKLPLMLIVDDNEDFRKFIGTMFQENYRILMAPDGEQALKLTLDRMPDLIIADVMMPRMDGFQLCREIKQDIRTSHIPVILLTAKAGDENKLQGLEAGADDYIAKPFNMEMLTLKVARILERQRTIHDQFKNKVSIHPAGAEITPLDEKFVKKAVALVEANIDNSSFLVEDLCREMGMSRVYFYKKILSLTDKTPSEFIRFIRLKRAAELLKQSQLYVNEVAYQTGFNDPKYFRKYFKDEFGVSPNEYKKKYEK